MVRKVLKIVAIVIGVLVVALFAIPFLFADKINEILKKKINEQVNAQVTYGGYSLSLIKHFPKITLDLNDLQVANNAPFQGDTLLQVKTISFAMDIMSYLRNGQLNIRNIDLDQPDIRVRVLADGSANYDIFKTDSTATTEEEGKEMSLHIERWAVHNGAIAYIDIPGNIRANLSGIEHEGSGDLEADLFDLVSKTEIKSAQLAYGGTEYLSGRTLNADLTIGMDLKNRKYTFKDNKVSINAFPLVFAGSVAMPDSNIQLDMQFSSPENSFKNLLSLIPMTYKNSFNDLQAKGQIAFSGFVKGTYNAVTYPAFQLQTQVKDGEFQYSGLPLPVSDVQLDLLVKSEGSDLDKMVIDASRFQLTIGKDQVKGRVKAVGLTIPNIDAEMKGKLNLAALTQAFPLEGTVLKGNLDLDVFIKGVYGGGQFPVTRALLNYTEGYIKSSTFPEPLENMAFKGTIVNTSGKMADTDILIDLLRFSLQGKPFEAHGKVRDLDNYQWDIAASGSVDLAKMTKIFPLEGMELAGEISGQLQSKGAMKDVDAGRYDLIPTSGNLDIQNLNYASKDLANPVSIYQAKVNFTPDRLVISDLKGKSGTSDFAGSGYINQYIKYLLDPNANMDGQFNLQSKNLNLNEWMGAPAAKASPEAAGALAIPKNLNFVVNAQIDRLQYEDLEIKQIKGAVKTQNGIVSLDKSQMEAMGGRFSLSGLYDSRDLTKPGFNFSMLIDKLSIVESAKKLRIVNTFLPIANDMSGEASGTFQLKGILGPDMVPNMGSIDASGVIKVIAASLGNIPALNKVLELTKFNALKSTTLKDLVLKLKINDGKLVLEPLDIPIENQMKLRIGGSTSLTGAIDYNLGFTVPSGKAGAAFNDVVQKNTGLKLSGTETIDLAVGVGGTYKNPTVKLGKSSLVTGLKDQVVDMAKQQVDAAKAKLEAEVDKAQKEAEARIKAEQDKLLAEADKKKKELEQQAKAQADKLKKQAAEKAKKEAEKAGKSLENEASKFLKGLGNKKGSSDTSKRN
ncbi:MAG: AsmA-like C-terminal region-containing protein [Saprospiraceae bacterium]